MKILQVINTASNKYLYRLSEDIKLILSNGVDKKAAWNLCLWHSMYRTMHLFLVWFVHILQSKKRWIQKRDKGWGGEVDDKRNSRSYWKADASTLVNISFFPHKQISQLGFKWFPTEFFAHQQEGGGMIEMSNQASLKWIHSIYALMPILSSCLCISHFCLEENLDCFFQIGLLNGKELRKLRATLIKGKIHNVNIHLPLEYLGKDIKHMQIKVY